jgi:hypothetical protein
MVANDPWAEEVTEKMKAKVAKFDLLAQKNEGARETHYPNQSAVTYVYLTLKTLYLLNIKVNKPKQLYNIMHDILLFITVKGDKTITNFKRVLNNHENIYGKICNTLDIKPMINQIIDSEHFECGDSANLEIIKHCPNEKLTLKRFIRIASVMIECKTKWSLMKQSNANFVENLKAYYKLENALGENDKSSLAMLWYMCIGRHNLTCVIVDHHELSAPNEMCKLLGKPINNAFAKPDHCFDIDL